MTSKPKPKPEKISFIKYYIKDGLFSIVGAIIEHAWHKLTGAWYCSYCQRYHGRRVIKYKDYPRGFLGGAADMCSLGEQSRKEEPTHESDA